MDALWTTTNEVQDKMKI